MRENACFVRRTRRRSCVCTVAGLALATTLVPLARASERASKDPYPPAQSLAEVRALVDKAPREHPRLLVNREGLAAIRASLAKDPLRRALADSVVRQADFLIGSSPIERRLEGRRLLGQSRRCVKRVTTLSMAFHLTSEKKYVERCEKEMLAVARFPDWNPGHFLDVAEMTFALAIGYDWLYDELGEDSRTKIRRAILDKGVVLPFETRHKGWVRASNNWGQVCHGGLTAGALAVLEHEPDLAARTVHSAIHNVTRAMAAYAPEGSYPEGPGYWAYGTNYNVVLIGILESALDTDFGLTRAAGFNKTGQYLSLVTGPSGAFFNYADGGARRGAQPGLYWFASRYDRPDWLLGEDERIQRTISAVSSARASSRVGRLFPLTLLWIGERSDISEIRMPLHWESRGETPITVHRSSWTEPNAVFVGVKAGSPSANHGQMDTGSFVLDSDGVRWATDLGAEGYHGIESRGMNLWSRAQSSDRWKIFRQQNHGHNTLVIDGKLQRASGKATIVRFSDDARFPHTIVDLTPVYEGQARSVRRGVALMPSGAVVIQDELTGLKPGSRVRWGMITTGTPDAAGETRIELRQAGKSLSLLSGNATSTWEIIDTSKSRNEWDSQNRGTRMVALHADAPESGEVMIRVLITPGSRTPPAGGCPKSSPLEHWGR